VICFITGVPGAGKTLAGLKLVHDATVRRETNSELAFLSGNGPLVTVLRAALAVDVRRRLKIGLRASARDPETLIQSVYAFKNALWTRDVPPVERVIVFDEAQRAWDEATNVKKLRGTRPCAYSEAALILHTLDRHEGWSALICLVGGGQEIHTGEAGLTEWGRAIAAHFPHWKIVTSPNALHGDDTGTRLKLFENDPPKELSIQVLEEFHLDNPTRQFRGKAVARWAECILSRHSIGAREAQSANESYPIASTRSLETAKTWLRAQARGSERYGLLASSGAKRLRAYGISLPPSRGGDVEHWFLASQGDVRSSFQLEVAATEFQVQGLEVDWACVCWGGDFLMGKDATWNLREFLGSRWVQVKHAMRQCYVENTYRVLLTRARRGIVIYVPRGQVNDPTTTAEGYDRTARYLLECGVQSLDEGRGAGESSEGVLHE